MSKKVYTAEFKKQAVELAQSMGNTVTAAKQLGVSDSAIYAWSKRDQSGVGLSKQNHSSPLDQENQRLRKENAELKKVNHILKSAAAFFSQDHLK